MSVYCSVLQCVAVCCSALWCVTMRCAVLKCINHFFYICVGYCVVWSLQHNISVLCCMLCCIVFTTQYKCIVLYVVL